MPNSLKEILEQQLRETQREEQVQEQARRVEPQFDDQFKIVLLYRNLKNGYRKLNYGLDGNLSPVLQLLFWLFVLFVVLGGIMGNAR